MSRSRTDLPLLWTLRALAALAGAITQATNTYAQPAIWHQLMQRGMAQHFSWGDAAKEYLSLYEAAMRDSASARQP